MFPFVLPEKKTWAEIRILAAGNQLFRSAVHSKHFGTCNSHNLQLFDIYVTIRELTDDRSVCFFYVLVSLETIQSRTVYQNLTQDNAYGE